MLSSVAERVYWLGRYMERVENSARLMDVYSSMLFDLPRGSNISWDLLLDITGSNEKFAASNASTAEISVFRFLLADLNNSSSMISSLRALRENARTTREVIPSEAWEHINKTYLYAKGVIESGIGRRVRRELFTELIADCQSLGGMLSGTMAHNTAYTFIQLGRALERADMTSRIVDVGSISLLPAFADLSREEESLEEAHKIVVWMNVLRSVSGYQAYRQNVANRVKGEGVVRFLLQDDEFPRSINFLLEFINTNLERLPNHDDVQLAIVRVKRITSEANVFHLLENGLLEFIDELQISFGDVHNEISKTWFGYE
ncbi:MAG: alpha-E domain-containing protein, partial [Gammaproteobacteria bacterium]|nr:alpha-E domain-containing protein [Gammaproteobacteria bacterium]